MFKMVSLERNYFESLYPYANVKMDQVYYCGHKQDNMINNASNRLLRVFLLEVNEYKNS